MPTTADQDLSVLDLPFDSAPDPEEFLRAALRWHFSPETGSPFWLERAAHLGFDPLTDIRTFADLTRFPNLAGSLRDVRGEDLVPRGYGKRPDVVGVYESGGTTGAPKRIVLLRDWLDRLLAWSSAQLDAHGIPQDVNWLVVAPTGPHMVGDVIKQQTALRGGLAFMVDLDPRWVKRLIADGKGAEAGAYAEHIVDQVAHVLRTQDIGVLMCTPPVLERLSQREDLAELIGGKVRAINWVGTQMDADTRHLYRTEIFPEAKLYSGYGSTMILGNASERPGLSDDEPCVYDPWSPYMTFSVIDPLTGRPVEYGERGQVVMHHVSKSFFMPNNLERDTGIRMPPPAGTAQTGDSVADIAPVLEFDNETVIEGVY
ncbi:MULTISPECIES: AMP-binding protein [unclassified Streptomyces]|uniref:AMP-binding protein n=1 Tax=unclassified Streptomyces TaxID=2593676 RepID=UPI000DAB521E|nr:MULTISPECIES: AMP-binding protein [unclassified Streptomyces]PZT74839.1 phenazine antibiotic biosynthesis protein [Streptomyces sp. AC1-42T]PZT82177.1 phenazine antibiotic biosynthesis protein [Streptomyces sp. AC1-42W]